MNSMLISTVIGSVAGIVGTGLGGALAFLSGHPGRRYLSTMLSISAGLMIAVVCFDLLPRAFELGGLGLGLTGTAIGVAGIAMIQELLERGKDKSQNNRQGDYLQTGILLGAGIAVHNFPEGLAIGTGFTAVQNYGLGLSLIIALHDIPEGIAMAIPMRMGGMGRRKVILSSLLAGIPTGIGALVGYVLGEISVSLISLCLGFAGGAMLYITCSELIPESRDLYRGRISGLGLIFGVILGILVAKTIG